MRHDPQAEEACRHQAGGEDEFVQEHEASATVRLRQLADEDGGDRHLAAKPDALDRAQHQQRAVVPGERAGEAHHRDKVATPTTIRALICHHEVGSRSSRATMSSTDERVPAASMFPSPACPTTRTSSLIRAAVSED